MSDPPDVEDRQFDEGSEHQPLHTNQEAESSGLESHQARRDESYGIMSGSENDSMASYIGVPISSSEDIRCVCENTDDDGFTIQCEDCLVWQHAVCVGISKDNVPESYFCELCRPDLHQKVSQFMSRCILFMILGRVFDCWFDGALYAWPKKEGIPGHPH